MKLVVLDFESYWSNDYSLTKQSFIDYVRDSKFHAQCLSYSINGSPAQVVEHDEIPATLKALDLESPQTITVGHNINGFDGFILSEIYNVKPFCILDTMAMSNWTGVSRVVPRNSLKELANYFKVGYKSQGTDISKGKRTKDDFTPLEWTQFLEYCREDTNLTTRICKAMIKGIPYDAICFASITAQMVTEPVFIINSQVLIDFKSQLIKEEAEAEAKLATLFKLPPKKDFKQAIRSDITFAEMLRLLNVEPPTKFSVKKSETLMKKMLERGEPVDDPEKYAVYTYAFSKTDLEFVDLLGHENPNVRALVGMRLDFKTSVPQARADALLNAARYNKPIPIALKVFHAHTSRYGAGSTGKSDGLNFQNIAKHQKKLLPLRQAITVPAGYKVVAADSSQIECRVLAYAAQQLDLLEQFKEHRDPYAELAGQFGLGYDAKTIHDGAKAGDSNLYQIRYAAKRLILSGGYGVGAGKVAKSLMTDGIMLDADREKHNNIAKKYWSIYRQTNDRIVKFWRTCDQVLGSLANGETGTIGGPSWTLFKYGPMELVSGEVVPSIMLPTGFCLRYPNLELKKDKDSNKLVYYYTKYMNGKPVENKIYGGSLTENLIQSLAFQILMWQAVRMAESGIKLKANIHDSFATVVPEEQAQATLDKMLAIMKTVPPFVEGCPLDAEGEIGNDFTIV